MSPLTPFNDRAKDDLFDQALTRLLAGDTTAVEDVQPDLRNVAVEMTRLAREAEWLDEDPGPSPTRLETVWMRVEPYTRAVAVIFLAVVLSGMGWIGLRLLQEDGQVGFLGQPSDNIVMAGDGVCSRAPMSDTDIGDALAATAQNPYPGMPGDHENVAQIQQTLIQLTRDWNECQRNGLYTQALAYESNGFIQLLHGTGPVAVATAEVGTSATPVVTPVPLQSTPISAQGLRTVEAQQAIVPMLQREDTRIGIYAVTSFTGDDERLTGAEIWMVPLNEANDWEVWPTVICFIYEDGQWVINRIDRPGSPSLTPTPIVTPSATPVATPKP